MDESVSKHSNEMKDHMVDLMDYLLLTVDNTNPTTSQEALSSNDTVTLPRDKSVEFVKGIVKPFIKGGTHHNSGGGNNQQNVDN